MADAILATGDAAPDRYELDDPAKFAKAARKAARLDVHHGPLTEQTLAERMVHRHGKDLRFCTTHGWLAWTGQRWRRDDLLEVERRAKETILSLGRQAFDIGDKDRRNAVLKFVHGSETNHRLKGVIALARAEPGIPIRADDLDGDPWLLNVENGTIDLRTGKLRPHERADLITKIAPVVYDPAAECPTWLKFLLDIFARDMAMIGFVQRALGHALTGVIRDHILHILCGGGANGKTTLIECIIGLLGDYGMPAAPGLLLQKHNEQHPTERADLRGKRFVADEELGEGQRLNEQTVKRLTGGNTIKGRLMHKDFFDFPPTHKLFLATNHKPEVHGRDFGIWRRVHLWPFAVTIADADQDKQLPEKLKAEWSGILAWLLVGCLDWQRIGLAAPEAVVAATNAYREESDLLGHFIGDCCETGDGKEVGGGILYTAYRLWCEDNGHRAMSNPNFSKRLLERDGITRERTAHSKYVGLWLTYSMDQRVKRYNAGNETQTTAEDEQ